MNAIAHTVLSVVWYVACGALGSQLYVALRAYRKRHEHKAWLRDVDAIYAHARSVPKGEILWLDVETFHRYTNAFVRGDWARPQMGSGLAAAGVDNLLVCGRYFAIDSPEARMATASNAWARSAPSSE